MGGEALIIISHSQINSLFKQTHRDGNLDSPALTVRHAVSFAMLLRQTRFMHNIDTVNFTFGVMQQKLLSHGSTHALLTIKMYTNLELFIYTSCRSTDDRGFTCTTKPGWAVISISIRVAIHGV